MQNYKFKLLKSKIFKHEEHGEHRKNMEKHGKYKKY